MIKTGFAAMLFLLVASLTLLGCSDHDSAAVIEENATTAATSSATIRTQERLLRADYATFRHAQISKPAYQLSLQVGTQASFTGQVRISFDLAQSNVSPLTIDFDSGSINALTVNGQNLAPDYEHWFISIAPEHLLAGSRNEIVIDYTRPYANDGAGLHKFTDPENGEVYLYTNFEPYDANRLFPHFDQPNLKAPLTLDVTAPKDWQVIANTRESSKTESSATAHWIFPATPPLASYVYAMHSGPFKSWEAMAGDIPLRLFVRSAMADYVDIDEWFEPTRQSFAFYQAYFAVRYPFAKYDQIIVPDFNAGAMENVAAVTFSERYLSRGVRSTAQKRTLASVIAHEMAHMWFGDLVTMNWWNGLWLNESFATYMANLALEDAGKFANVWDSFYTGNKLSAYAADERVTTHPIELEVPSTADAFTNFDSITYGKGGSVLKQLPYFIGKENFRQGISAYLQANAYGNTELDDFVAALSASSGIDLQQWQEQWLYASGVNTLRADFTCEMGSISRFELIQTAPQLAAADKILRTQRTQIGLYRYSDNQMSSVAKLPVTYSGSTTAVPEAVGQPCPDLVLPNEADWAYIKIELDPVSRTTLQTHINDIRNPTTRLMLWQSLYDSVTDSTLPLNDYISFLLENAAQETDDNVLRHISGRMSTAFNYLSAFDLGASLKLALETEAFERLQRASAGSEAQKIWLNTAFSLAHSPSALRYLSALLDGTETLAGLPIDQDLRWDIVIKLNRYQFGDYTARLTAEIEQDSSDAGSNMALAAEVIRPDPTIKQRWLNTITQQSGGYKLATQRVIMAYLFPAEQHALLEPLKEDILAAIPILNETASQEFLGEYVNYMDVATCSAASVARLAQANERFADLQPLIRKSYLIHHQNDERCVSMKALMQQQ